MKSIYFHSAVRHFLLLLLLALSLYSWADASRCFNWYGQNRQTRAKTFFHKSDHLTLTKNVHELLYHYIHAKNEGDPQIAFLEQLGFRFDPSAAIIPTPETILERVEALILQVQNKEGLHIGVYIRNPKVMALDRQIIERRGPIMGDFGEYLSETLVWANHDHGA